MKEGTVRANGLEFAYLEEGSGPPVLLFHGFPDNAYTWRAQFDALSSAGYHVYAPFNRGYLPTQIPKSGFYDSATLVEDAAALVEALAGEPAFVVGHDFGALMTYGLCTAFPDRIRRAVAMAVPHPAAIPRIMGSYDQAKRSFYIFLFQVPFLPEAVVPMNDFDFIERLWRDWSPGFDGAEHISAVKSTFMQPGVLEAAVGYYRTFFDPSQWDPALQRTRDALSSPIALPVMTMFGLEDGCFDPEFSGLGDDSFTGEYERVMVPGAGHFLHLEQPEFVNAAILRWLAA